MEELRECPFCGGDKCVTNTSSAGILFYSFCPKCRACGDEFDAEEEAIAAWTRRTIPEKAIREAAAEILDLIKSNLAEQHCKGRYYGGT